MITRTKKSTTAVAASFFAATLALTGCDYLEEEANSFTGEPKASDAAEAGTAVDGQNSLHNDLSMDEEDARAALEALPVEEPRSMDGYSREDYPHWRSANAWGWETIPDASDCDAREATLARDGENVSSNPDTCRADEGEWVDPYTGEEFTDSTEIDIDHVVPLAAAHRAGAADWTEDQRTAFANAPVSLVATGAASNREKGDKGPEAWPDAEESWCVYSMRWIEVKDEFDLNLTSNDEYEALEEMLDTCSEGSA